ncbi:hypothetical protein ABW19_dt0205417 [Dactylella cylindrospora]|nr:hypothetical protein ABW19_dt0205417 [Dactylella cylindrospora]
MNTFGYDPFDEPDRRQSHDPLDDFDDNDLSDDDDIVTHRINFHRGRVVTLVEQGKWEEALSQLEACGFPPEVFKTRIVKAVIQNMITESYGDAMAAHTLKDMVYTATEGVHPNLLLYYNRALSNYYFGQDAQLALTDCKRGLKLAKKAGPLIRNSLEGWARSDIAELAAKICNETNMEADAHYYKTMIQESHETHPLLLDSTNEVTNIDTPAVKQMVTTFLLKYNIRYDSAKKSVSGTAEAAFTAFVKAFEEKNFAAAYYLTTAHDLLPTLTNDGLMGLGPIKRAKIHSNDSGVYLHSFLHFVSIYPESKFGPFIAEELLKRGVPIDFCSDKVKMVNSQSIGSPGNYTALGLAVVYNNLPVMKVLVAHGALYEFDNKTTFASPLLLAAYLAPRIGSLAPLKYIMSLNPDLTRKDYWDNTVFYYVANLGNIKPIMGSEADVQSALDMMVEALIVLLTSKKKDLSRASGRNNESALDVVRRNKKMPGVTKEMSGYYDRIEGLFITAGQRVAA